MLLKYHLTDSQYQRFQHANNNKQIQALGRKAGVVVTDEKIVGGIETMYFKGRCSGTMALVRCIEKGVALDVGMPFEEYTGDHWECWIQVRSKPWWLPWALLDYGFRKALV